MIEFLRYSGDISVGECVKNEHVGEYYWRGITMNETIKIMRYRRSIRRFLPEQIKDEELQAIIESGLYAPSAHNDQPWHFTVLRDKAMIDKLNIDSKEAAKDFHDEFVRNMANNEKLHTLFAAPLVIIVSGKDDAMMPRDDCAAATENMLIAAESMGIGACWIGFVRCLFENHKEKVMEDYKIPEGHTPYYVVSFGYKKSVPQREIERKPGRVTYL